MTAPLGTCSPHKMRSTIRAFVPTSATGAVPAARARLVSYNILADELCMTEKHSYCPVKDREWHGDSGRGARLVAELLSYEADIVCLQECSLRKFDDCFRTGLGKEFTGFHHSAHLSTRRAAAEARMSVTGLATFVRSAAWKPVNVQAVRLGEDSDARGHIGSLQQTLRARDESVLLVLLEHVASGARLAVGNTHLHWDPRQPHVKSSQAELAARGLAAFASVRPAGAPSTEASAATSCPVALVGDFNSVPHLQPSFLPSAQRAALPELLPEEWRASAVYRLLSNGTVESTHPEHPTAFAAGQAASKEVKSRKLQKRTRPLRQLRGQWLRASQRRRMQLQLRMSSSPRAASSHLASGAAMPKRGPSTATPQRLRERRSAIWALSPPACRYETPIGAHSRPAHCR